LSKPRAIALTIAGSDSSGGAGIQADLKTFSMFGVDGATAITALTAQNAAAVTGILPTPPAFVAAQIDAVCAGATVCALKTGMLPSAAIITAAAEAIERHRLPRLVVDPVMIATSGAPLISDGAIAALCGRLIPLAELITPNLPEAARLLGVPAAATPGAMEAQARSLQTRCGARGVLVKGGHSQGRDAADVLIVQPGAPAMWFALPRIETTRTHGTGCTLSAAIAALRALDVPLEEAVRRAKLFVWSALSAAVGTAAGGIDHLYSIGSDKPPA